MGKHTPLFMSRFLCICMTVAVVLAFSSQCYAANIHIEPSQEITSKQAALVGEAVQRTINYMSTKYDLQIDHDVEINIYGKGNASIAMSEQDINNNVGGNSSLGKINLILSPTASRYYISFLTSHELVHQYQMQAYGGTGVMNKNLWFVEGMADYLAVNISSYIDSSKYNVFASAAKTRTLSATYTLNNITAKKDWTRHFNAGYQVYGKADRALIYLNDNYPSYLMWDYLTRLYNEDADFALRKVYGLNIRQLDQAISGTDFSVDDLDSYLN